MTRTWLHVRCGKWPGLARTGPGRASNRAPTSGFTSMDSEELIGFFLIGIFGCLCVLVFAKFVF